MTYSSSKQTFATSTLVLAGLALALVAPRSVRANEGYRPASNLRAQAGMMLHAANEHGVVNSLGERDLLSMSLGPWRRREARLADRIDAGHALVRARRLPVSRLMTTPEQARHLLDRITDPARLELEGGDALTRRAHARDVVTLTKEAHLPEMLRRHGRRTVVDGRPVSATDSLRRLLHHYDGEDVAPGDSPAEVHGLRIGDYVVEHLASADALEPDAATVDVVAPFIEHAVRGEAGPATEAMLHRFAQGQLELALAELLWTGGTSDLDARMERVHQIADATTPARGLSDAVARMDGFLSRGDTSPARVRELANRVLRDMGVAIGPSDAAALDALAERASTLVVTSTLDLTDRGESPLTRALGHAIWLTARNTPR